jgi:hypothetical protein
MRTFMIAAAASLALAGVAVAHPATEQYIPIGASTAQTMLGTISATPEPAAVGGETALTMQSDQQVASYAVGPRTRIYVDRSSFGQASTLGGVADLQAGLVVEVCLEPNSNVARWIKVRPAG